MAQAYKTLLKTAGAEYVVNKSRFIGHAAPVTTAEAALAFLSQIKQEYRDASHNCYAYIIGQNAGIMRYSDDGEPGGTAGMPIIEVIKARRVVDCVVVVTRYFGGILLGAGGLVRAYSHTCVLALNAARVCVMHPTKHWLCEVSYPLWDRTRHELSALPVRLDSPEYGTTVVFNLSVREADSDAALAALTRVTDGRAEVLLTGEDYSPWEEPLEGEEDGLV